MPSFNAWASVLGPELVGASQQLTDVLFPSPEKQYAREKVQAERELLPLEMEAERLGLQQKLKQLQSGSTKKIKEAKFDERRGVWQVLFDDGTQTSVGYGQGQTTLGPDAPKTIPYKEWDLDQLREKRHAGTPLTPVEEDRYRDYLSALPANRPQAGPESGIMIYPRRQSLEELEQGAGASTQRPLPSGAPPTGYLGPQQLPGGNTATVRLMGISDERLNKGRETNIPLLVPGQIDVAGLAAGNKPTPAQREIALQHAVGRVARGETIPSYDTVDAASAAAREESQKRGQVTAPGTIRTPTSGPVPPGIVKAYEDNFRRLGKERATEAVSALQEMDTTGASPASRAAKQAYLSLWGNEPLPPGLATSPTVVPGTGTPPAPEMGEPATPVPFAPGATPEYKGKTAAALRTGAAAPKHAPEEYDGALHLYNAGQLPSAVMIPGTTQINLDLLSPQDQEKARQAGKMQKHDAGYNRVLRQAQPYIAELTALKDSQKLIGLIEPLLQEENVGIQGYATGLFQDYVRSIPGVPKALQLKAYNKAIPKLEAMKDMLAYVHANALKQIAGAPQRGVIASDLDRVLTWFDPFAARSNPERLKAGLESVQEFVQLKRGEVEKMVRALKLDPETLQPLSGTDFTGVGSAAPDFNAIMEQSE